MSPTHISKTALLLLLGTASGSLPAINYGFLEQAPVRFLTDADKNLLGDTVIAVLDGSKDGEGQSWQGKESGNSGTVTAVKSFMVDGNDCRRIQIVTLAKKASTGRASSMLDMCSIQGEWKILRVPQ